MKRPWNRVNLPVYSISSKHAEQENMHICTYVSSVSMSPKRMMVAIFNGTKTLELAEKEKHFVLQLLADNQYNLVKLLGQSSGKTINKIGRLEKRKLIGMWKNFKVLKEALAYMELKTINISSAGDHVVFVCDVISFYNNLPGEPLTLNLLRDKGIVRG
jgi:flavin reductase (DIM6/NTAB) family NADH-FMN oxidoreductase RutF